MRFKYNLGNNITPNNIECVIRPAEIKDAQLISQQRNYGDWKFLGDSSLYSTFETEQWLKNLPRSSKRYMVDLIPGSVTIGIIRIDHIDLTSRHCFVGLDIYDDYKGKGLATPIYKTLINYLFRDANFNTLYLYVLESNERAIHIYNKLGFKECGRMPNYVFRDGDYQDYIAMYLSRSEWKNEHN